MGKPVGEGEEKSGSAAEETHRSLYGLRGELSNMIPSQPKSGLTSGSNRTGPLFSLADLGSVTQPKFLKFSLQNFPYSVCSISHAHTPLFTLSFFDGAETCMCSI